MYSLQCIIIIFLEHSLAYTKFVSFIVGEWNFQWIFLHRIMELPLQAGLQGLG